MISRLLRSLIFVSLLVTASPAFSGAITLGLNLEFVEGRFNDEAFDGGWGIHAGYEFQEWKNWQFGGLIEYMNGWNGEGDLTTAGEMTYDSLSLYATARPNKWPVMFKVGIVDADYKVLLEDYTQNFREVSDIGYAYGVALVIGDEKFRLSLLDLKRIIIGDDSFTSYGISLAIFALPY